MISELCVSIPGATCWPPLDQLHAHAVTPSMAFASLLCGGAGASLCDGASRTGVPAASRFARAVFANAKWTRDGKCVSVFDPFAGAWVNLPVIFLSPAGGAADGTKVKLASAAQLVLVPSRSHDGLPVDIGAAHPTTTQLVLQATRQLCVGNKRVASLLVLGADCGAAASSAVRSAAREVLSNLGAERAEHRVVHVPSLLEQSHAAHGAAAERISAAFRPLWVGAGDSWLPTLVVELLEADTLLCPGHNIACSIAAHELCELLDSFNDLSCNLVVLTGASVAACDSADTCAALLSKRRLGGSRIECPPTVARPQPAAAPTAADATFTLLGVDDVLQRLDRLLLQPLRRAGGLGVLRAMGLNCPRGALIVGATGTGKTALARELAAGLHGLPGVRVEIVDALTLLDKEVGATEKNIHRVFATLRAAAASGGTGAAAAVLFLDNIDALAPPRGGQRAAEESTSAADRSLSTLLVEMDGISGDLVGAPPVIVVACAPSVESLDAAVVRPGRLDIHIQLWPPSTRVVAEIVVRRLSALGPLDVADVIAVLEQRGPRRLSFADAVAIARESAVISCGVQCEEQHQLTAAELLQAVSKAVTLLCL